MGNDRGAAGGAANAGGVQFASYGAAWAAVKLLVGNAAVLPWALPTRTFIRKVECEKNTSVDDMVLSLSNNGTVYIQFKHGLTAGFEFKKAVAQMVAQFCAEGFSPLNDRLVIFTDSSASATIRETLKRLLDRLRNAALDTASKDFLHNEQEKSAYSILQSAATETWPKPAGVPDERLLRRFLTCMHITAIDFFAEEQIASTLELLGRITEEGRAKEVWARLTDISLTTARNRSGFDRPVLWELLRKDELHIDPPVGQRGGEPFQLTKIVAEMTKEAIEHYVSLSGFSEDLYVARAEFDQEFRTFVACDARLLVVTGQSGHGKSNISVHYALNCKDQPVLLVRGEELEMRDAELSSSICRLVIDFCHRCGARPPAVYEIEEWFREAGLLLIVDGLDRAPTELLSGAGRWMSGTLAWLAKTQAKLMITTRPESWPAAAKDLAKVPSFMYRTADEEGPFRLDAFTPLEAKEATSKLNRPDLARYRHPGMISLTASLLRRDGELLTHYDVIEAYLSQQWKEIASLAGKTEEQIVYFVRQVASVFLRVGRSSISFDDIHHIVEKSDAVYNGMRRANLLDASKGQIRLNPDEVAEHLQAQQLDITAELQDIDAILERPMRRGILRSAVVQCERTAPDQAREYFRNLIDLLEKSNPDAMRAFCVPIALELKDWSGYMPLFTRMVRSWTDLNLLLGKDLLAEFLASSRLSPMERIALLWEIVGGEDGYDWRSKHWLTPEYAPNFRVTAWSRLMRRAVTEAGVPGLSFIMRYFDSDKDLHKCREANLGDLAQGMFFLCGEQLVGEALDLLLPNDGKSVRRMRANLLQHYPEGGVTWLSAKVGKIDDLTVLSLLMLIPSSAVKERYQALATELLRRATDATHHRHCLLPLVLVSDVVAVQELLEAPNLYDNELNALLGTRGALFGEVVQKVFARVASGSLDAELLSRAYVPDLGLEEINVALGAMIRLIENEAALVSSFASILEGILYTVSDMDVLPENLECVVEAAIMHGSPEARRNVIYFATNHTHGEELSKEGARFRRSVLERVLARETDEHNLRLLIQNLVSRPAHAEYADDDITMLISKFPIFNLRSAVERFSFLRNIS